MAAGAADVILDATSLPAAGRKKGVMSKVVANASMGSFGWQLMCLEVAARRQEPQRQEVRHHLAGSGSTCCRCGPSRKEDHLHPRAVGGGGLCLTCSPQCRRRRGVFPAQLPDRQSGERAPSSITQGCAAQPHRRWITPDKYAQEKPHMVQKTLKTRCMARWRYARQQDPP